MKDDLLAGGFVLAVLGITTFLLNVMGVGWFSADVLMPVTAGAFCISAVLFYLSYRSAEKCLNSLIGAREVEQICQAVFQMHFGLEVTGYLKFHVEQALKKPKEGDNCIRFWRVVVVVAALLNETGKLAGGASRMSGLKEEFIKMMEIAGARSNDSSVALEWVDTAKALLTGKPISEADVPINFRVAALSTRLSDYVIKY